MQDIVFLLDVDNTLLDNDGVVDDLRRHLVDDFGREKADRYWIYFEELRAELGYTDYLGALQRYRARELRDDMNDPRLLQMSTWLVDYPFASRLYPDALATLEHLKPYGPTVILSDGDVVFQPRKVQRSGLWQAVEGRVLIYIHKELMLDEVRRTFPARHYVMVDDKPRILAALKSAWGDAVTTVFPRQGHYAFDADEVARHPRPDITVDHIGDIARADIACWCATQGASHEQEHAAAA